MVLAVAALERSLRLLDFSILSVFKLEKFESTSVLVRGDPLAFRFTIVDISYTYSHYVADKVIVQVTVIVSSAALLTTLNLVRHNMVPLVEALKIPASVTAPVASPASKDAT